jgi:hypothetical protein
VIQVVTLADSAVQIAVKPWVAVADYGVVAGELNLSSHVPKGLVALRNWLELKTSSRRRGGR